MLASYALELHALKAELQSTLARLGVDPVTSSSDAASPPPEEPITTRRRPRSRPITRWNRRQLTQELAAASERRRQLELQLERELQQENNHPNDSQQEEQEHNNRRRVAYQTAITELQQQRAQITRQMQQDAAADAASNTTQDIGNTAQETRNSGQEAGNSGQETTQYSIEGVVTLEPLSSAQRPVVSTITSSRSGGGGGDVSFRPPVAPPPAPESTVDTVYPRRSYWNTPDALNDVFSLQVKFAETMLKLEKSVQMRDQLLHRGRRGEHEGRRSGRRRRVESGSNSDSSVIYRQSRSSDSFSSSAYSFSSVDMTPQRGRRYPHFGASRATTAETLAPSSSGAGNSPTNDGTAPVVSISAMSHQEASNSLNETAGDIAHHTEPLEQEEEVHRTPTTCSSVTTPTTGSDQKSSASSSKQVRFGEDAYSTPVIARRFNFDGPSIDEDEDEEKEQEEVESVLSFLGGSSVTSAELNDVSFLRAFERFRRELQASKRSSAMQSLVQPPLARKLFPEPTALNAIEAVVATPDVDISEDHSTKFSAFDGLEAEELQERRRQLCLDIQAESAQLVLNFGVGTGSQDAEHTKARLLALRDELKAVDTRLGALQ